MEQKKTKGFTLTEILIAVAIISILTSTGIAAYSVAAKKARDARRKADLENVRNALEIYRSQNGYYPSSGGDWTYLSNLATFLVPSYINQIPSDPKTGTTTPYGYKSTNYVGGRYYGYCLETKVEIIQAETPCTPQSDDYNYTLANP